MIDREKVIKAVEDAFDLVYSDFIGTNDFNETEWEQNKADAIAMLKAQEAKTPVECEHNGYWCYTCPTCGNHEELFKEWNYCPFCGQAVKWE